MKRPVKACFLYLFCCVGWIAFSEPVLKVKLVENLRNIKISSASNIKIKGYRPGEHDLNLIHFRKINSSTLSLNGKILRKGSFILSSESPLQIGRRKYRGVLEVKPLKAGIRVVNFIELEEYLKGVIPAEMSPKWHPEALKAQAVASRTYAVYKFNENRNGQWHLTGDTNDQVYRGIYGETKSVLKAIQNTRHEIITMKGKIVPTYYHSNSGGTTEDSANVWDKALEHIVPLKVPYGKSDPNYYWRYRVSSDKILGALAKLGYPLKRINDIEIDRLTLSGRVYTLKVKGNRTQKIPGTRFRAAMGNRNLKSTKFRVEKQGKHFVFQGSGYGHGVGLCQWCTKEMAEKGYNYRQILKSFYRNVEISQVR